MVHRAVADLGLDLSRAYVVGDQPRDLSWRGRWGSERLGVIGANAP